MIVFAHSKFSATPGINYCTTIVYTYWNHKNKIQNKRKERLHSRPTIQMTCCKIFEYLCRGKAFFKTHIRWELKWAFLIACRPSVCLLVYPSVCKLFSFSSSSLDKKAKFHQTWKTHSRVKGNQVHWDQRPGLFQRAGNSKKNVLTI